jgi:hypothetical protein
MRSSPSRNFRVRAGCVVVAVIGLITLASAPAAGQGAASQSLIGQVTDDSGAVLPGVTVTVTSPALQVPEVTGVTNELGEYRIAPLPIGAFEIRFELAAFRTAVRRDVRLTVGFTARIDVVLGLDTVNETVTVSGASPLVDVAATSASTLLNTQVLEGTPIPRNGLMSLMALTPGVRTFLDVGGANMNENANARVFAQGGEFWYTLEGIGLAGTGNKWDLQAIEEARVQTLGTDPEFPTRGLQVNAIVKSGGNDFHGGLLWAQSNENFQSNNIDDELEAFGFAPGNALVKQFDFGGQIGGRIVEDKLWFYTALRKRGSEYSVLNCSKPDGSPCANLAGQEYSTSKVSWQATRSNRIVGFVHWNGKNQTEKTNDLVAWEAREAGFGDIVNYKAEWQGVFGNSLVGSLQFGGYDYYAKISFNGGAPGKTDITTERVWGENLVAGDDTYNFRTHPSGSLTWYKPNSFLGNHEIKTGFDYMYTTTGKGEHEKQVNYYLVFDNGAPYQVAVFNSPTLPLNRWKYFGLYLKDTWTIGRRLTLNAGLRFAHDDMYLEQQCRGAAQTPGDVVFPASCFDGVQMPKWNTLAPRLRAAYDVSGDGKTVIKGGWGRYDHMRQFTELNRHNPLGLQYGMFFWHDLNGNDDYDGGEVNLDLNGPDFDRTTGQEFSAIPPKAVINPDEKEPKLDEYSVSLERELVANLGVRITGLHSRYRNIYRLQNNLRPYSAHDIPVTNRDPGPDGRVGTGDDGGLVTYYEYSPALAGARFEELMVINDPKVTQTFSSIELAAVKRLATRWHLMVSYSATKKHIPFSRALEIRGFGGGGADAGNLDPNAEINSDDRTWEWDAKVVGGYTLPADVLVSAILDHRSGDVFARQVQFRGGRTIPSIVLNVEPIGAQRLPNINALNLRAEKSFRFSAAQRVSLQLNVYNTLNANTATRVQVRSGASFLTPREIMAPRVMELSANSF